MKTTDIVQTSAPPTWSTADYCPVAQKEETQGISTPSERLELLGHMAFPPMVLPKYRFPESSSYITDFNTVWNIVYNGPGPESTEAMELVHELHVKWPTSPPLEILFGEPWGLWKKPIIRTNTRLTNKVEDALTNLTKAGCLVSESEHVFLRYITTHCFGWSASDPQHMDEPCFKFIQYSFRHLGHLYPILDDIWWPEVVEQVPRGVNPDMSLRILLSNGKTYYVYLPETDVMYKAGSSLEEVFLGLKEHKDQATPEDGSWECENGPDWPDGHYMYFPNWATAKDPSRNWEPAWEIEPFVPPNE